MCFEYVLPFNITYLIVSLCDHFLIKVSFTYQKCHPFKVDNSVVFRTFTKLCNHYSYLISEHFSLAQKETLDPLAATAIPPTLTPGSH